MFWIGVLAERLRVQNGIELCSICGWKVWKRSSGAKEIRRGKELGELVYLKMELAKVH
jgi:hypothetical protein